MRKIIVGSRESALALTQTNWVIDQLRQLGPEYDFEIRKILTKGDKILDVTLSKVGGKGLFVKEIEQALLDGEIDFAVHSLKDMPAEIPGFLITPAIPARIDPRDCLIAGGGRKLAELPQGAKVGTSSLRRSAQLKLIRPDLQIEPLRGNINTRLRKLDEEAIDAIVLAAAGIERMGWSERVSEYIDPLVMIPAVGQGALAVQCRENDRELRALLEKLDDRLTRVETTAERAFLDTLNGGCQVPIGAYATWKKGLLSITGIVASPDGKIVIKDNLERRLDKSVLSADLPEALSQAMHLGRTLAEDLLERGANDLLESVRAEYL